MYNGFEIKVEKSKNEHTDGFRYLVDERPFAWSIDDAREEKEIIGNIKKEIDENPDEARRVIKNYKNRKNKS